MDLYGLIGKPLSHSFSEKLFTQKFRNLQLNAQYKLFELDDIEQLPKLISDNDNLKGLNVTIPYKCSVIPFLDELDHAAKIVGAVNTIKISRLRKQPKLIGFNTDVQGFTASIQPLVERRHDISKALILGTGGAGKAVQYVLRTMGIGYTEVSRHSKKAGQLSYPMITSSVLKTHLLIINATPVGMYPDEDNSPDLLYKYISPKHVLIDLIYNPEETLFLKLGRRAGATTLNGMIMFEKQAEETWKLWQ